LTKQSKNNCKVTTYKAASCQVAGYRKDGSCWIQLQTLDCRVTSFLAKTVVDGYTTKILLALYSPILPILLENSQANLDAATLCSQIDRATSTP
jgi:hypothetical protein